MRRTSRIIFTSLIFSMSSLILILGPLVQFGYASKSPYDSGYDHGCDDAGISDPDDRYINQQEKGPSFHTDEFMSGYNDGYVECSDGSNSDRSRSNGDLADWPINAIINHNNYDIYSQLKINGGRDSRILNLEE